MQCDNGYNEAIHSTEMGLQIMDSYVPGGFTENIVFEIC